MQSSGTTQNGINLSKQRFLINVTEVFGSMPLVQFLAMSSRHRCKCGRKEYVLLRYLCNVKTLKDFGSVPLNIVETVYRLQKVYAVASNTNPVEHEEVKIARKKLVRLLFLQMKPNTMMKMPTTATMNHN